MPLPIKRLLRLIDDGVACCGGVGGCRARCTSSLIVELRSDLARHYRSLRNERFFFGTRISIINSAVVVAGALRSVLWRLALDELYVDLLLCDRDDFGGVVILDTYLALFLLYHVQSLVLVTALILRLDNFSFGVASWCWLVKLSEVWFGQGTDHLRTVGFCIERVYSTVEGLDRLLPIARLFVRSCRIGALLVVFVNSACVLNTSRWH